MSTFSYYFIPSHLNLQIRECKNILKLFFSFIFIPFYSFFLNEG